ncbi:MAG: hypothetical protein ACREMY_04690 [bacterium]
MALTELDLLAMQGRADIAQHRLPDLRCFTLTLCPVDVLLLIAEVRRLRASLDRAARTGVVEYVENTSLDKSTILRIAYEDITQGDYCFTVGDGCARPGGWNISGVNPGFLGNAMETKTKGALVRIFITHDAQRTGDESV